MILGYAALVQDTSGADQTVKVITYSLRLHVEIVCQLTHCPAPQDSQHLRLLLVGEEYQVPHKFAFSVQHYTSRTYF